jgi:hypothetical protein
VSRYKARSEPENCPGAGFLMGAGSVSRCSVHYKLVSGAGVKAKTVTSLMNYTVRVSTSEFVIFLYNFTLEN